MRAVSGRPEARYLPSRHCFALFRLAGYFRLRRYETGGGAPPPQGGSIFVIDPHQSAVETYLVAIWVTLTAACFVTAGLETLLPLPAAVVLALPLTAAALEVPMLTVGPLLVFARDRLRRRRGTDAIHLNSVLLMLILAAFALWFAAGSSWARFAAWQFLGIALLNAIGAAALIPLRDSIARLERAVGGSPSAP